jgi:hypothetical protein
MSRLKDQFSFSITLGLLVGLVASSMVKFHFSYPSADWAARGVPLGERLVQKWVWELYGFVPGALVGFIAGMLVYQLFPPEGAQRENAERERRLEKARKVLTFLFFTAMIIYSVLVVANVL